MADNCRFLGTIQGAFLPLQQGKLNGAIQNLIFCLVGTSLMHQIIGQQRKLCTSILLKNKFSQWYIEQVLKQLEENSNIPLNQIELDPIDLCLPVMKELGAGRIVEMAKCIKVIVNGFIKAGISTTLDSDDSSSGSELDGCDQSSALFVSCEFTDSEYVSSMEDLTTG